MTHIDGHIPAMDELVEFLALAFICLADFADMVVLFVDDFQWVDSFSWKIFRVLCKRSKKMLMLCAMRSHDKQALRRLTNAANRQGEIQNQMIEISVVPLDFSEIQLLMAVVLGFHEKAIPESLCTDVFQRTGGLPVYVVQMLENMKRKKTVELGEDGMLKWTAAGLKDKVRNSTVYSCHGALFLTNCINGTESGIYQRNRGSNGRDILEQVRIADIQTLLHQYDRSAC